MKKINKNKKITTSLKVGDTLMIISGGNSKTNVLKGEIGKLKAFAGKNCDRVIIDGLNKRDRFRKATKPGEEGRVEKIECSIHISNVMFFSEKFNKPVRLKSKKLNDGTKVRGYLSPENKEFLQA
jgi:ribosomal protein L24